MYVFGQGLTRLTHVAIFEGKKPKKLELTINIFA